METQLKLELVTSETIEFYQEQNRKAESDIAKYGKTKTPCDKACQHHCQHGFHYCCEKDFMGDIKYYFTDASWLEPTELKYFPLVCWLKCRECLNPDYHNRVRVNNYGVRLPDEFQPCNDAIEGGEE